MHVHEVIGILAALIGSTASIPYFISILNKETILNRASWFVWTLVGGVLFSSYVASGAKATIFLPALYLLTNATFFVMSLKYGEGGINRFDIICVLIAVFAILVWWLTRRSDYANYITIFAEFVGFLPTYKKIWKRPSTESLVAWGIVTVAQLLNVFAIDQKRLVVIADPVVVFVEYLVVVLMLLRRFSQTLASRKPAPPLV